MAALVFLSGLAVGAESGQLPLSPYVPQAGSEAELASFTSIQLETGARARLPLITTFLESFPESELRYLVLHYRWRVLVEADFPSQEIIDSARDGIAAADEFLGRRLSSVTQPRTGDRGVAELELRDLRVAYYRSMVRASRRLSNLPRIAEYTRNAVDAERAAFDAYQAVFPPGSPEFVRRQASHRAIETGLLRDAMMVFRRAGDLGAVVDFGRQVLAAEPDELVTLMVLAAVMSEIQPGEGGPRAEYLSPALGYITRAIQLLGDSFEQQGIALNATNRVVLGSAAQSTLGWIYYHQGEYAAAEDALLTALDGRVADPTVHLRLGLVYSDTERSSEALSHLARAVAGDQNGSEVDDEARMHLERVYLEVYGSLEGLPDFISRESSNANAGDGVGR